MILCQCIWERSVGLRVHATPFTLISKKKAHATQGISMSRRECIVFHERFRSLFLCIRMSVRMKPAQSHFEYVIWHGCTDRIAWNADSIRNALHKYTIAGILKKLSTHTGEFVHRIYNVSGCLPVFVLPSADITLLQLGLCTLWPGAMPRLALEKTCHPKTRTASVKS